MKKVFPFLNWIRNYNKGDFIHDFPAGLTVGIMLIPQGMAYAMIAGLPPVYGLYASLVPPIVYALMGTSRQLAIGPTAMDSILVAAGLSVIASSGTDQYLLLAIILALIIGLIQLFMGVFKLGFLVNFLSKPVISGFTSAAAIIIGVNQVEHLLGINVERSNQVQSVVLSIVENIGATEWLALLIGIIGVIILMICKRFIPRAPASLIVVTLGIAVASTFQFNEKGVSIIGDIPKGLPVFELPKFDLINIEELFPIALTLALIGFMEAISIAKAIEQKHSYRVDANQELIALGSANIIGSLFQSYPTTAGFSRTAVNDQAGAKTGAASIIAALVIGLTLLFLTPLFYHLPKAILASIIIVAVLGLVDIKYPKRLWKNRKEEFGLLLFTFITTLTIGIKEGIVYGVIVSLLLLIYRTTKPHLAILGRIPKTDLYRNIKRYPEALEVEGVLILRFDAQLYFANAKFFRENINQLISEREGLCKLIISSESISFIDSSAAEMLRRLIKELHAQGIEVIFTNAIGPVRDIFKKIGIDDVLPANCFHNTVHEAIRAHLGDIDPEQKAYLQKIASQANE
ncbi:MAG: sulfate permease [Flavobacteriales bacterium]|nr:sulfate permease [Flavobacteriales bacterium]